MNKRGSGPGAIAILALLILVLYTFAGGKLYSALNANSNSIGDSRFADTAYAYKNKVMFYFDVAAREAFVSSYQKVLNNPKEDFSNLFKSRLTENLGNLDLNDRFVSKFYELTRDGKYIYDLNEEGVTMNYSDMVFQSTFVIKDTKWVLIFSYDELTGHLGMVYRPFIEFSLNYYDFDLPSINEINNRLSDCGKEISCLQDNFPEFNVAPIKSSVDKLLTGGVSFESKERYFIGGKLQNINFKI